MSMYLRTSNSLHSILASVLCKKMKQYWLKFHASGQRNGYIDSSVTTWYGSTNHMTLSYANKMTVPIPRGMVQPITAAVLENSAMTDKDGTLHPHASSHFANSEGIWNNYVDIQQQIMQIRFIIFLSTWGCKSLGDPTRQHKVWWKILLNRNSWYLTETFESIHTLFLQTISDYYLGFWAFLGLKSVYILIKTCQSEGFILMQCILGNFQYGCDHNMWNVRIFSLKEYEIIILTYNRKTCW